MDRWEYKVLRLPDNEGDHMESLIPKLDELGRFGWELIQAPQSGTSPSLYYFKRRKSIA